MAPSRYRVVIVGVVIVVSIALACVFLIQREIPIGGDLMGSTDVTGFTLCKPDDGSFVAIEPSIVTPTTVIYVCGYLQTEIENPAARNVCLGFYVTRGDKSIHSQQYCRAAPGYFSVALESNEFFTPATYSVKVMDVSRRNWEEMISFVIK